MAVLWGHHFHATQDYMSRIRGGRNSYAVRIGSEPVRAGREAADILLCLSPDHIPRFLPQLKRGGFALADVPSADPPVLAAPLKQMAVSAGSPILANMAGAGIIACALGIPVEILDPLLAADFKGDFLEKNRKALSLGEEWAKERVGEGFRLPRASFGPRLILSGNEALALGAIAGGCKFAAGYPMTPGTGILASLADNGPAVGLVFEQAEDEIAALNMAIGASYAGARAMVSTSGGGFALMTEAFDLAQHAMDLAEAYQAPAILLTDQHLADTIVDMDPEKFEIRPVRRHVVRAAEVPRTPGGKYLRYAVTGDGVSWCPGCGNFGVLNAVKRALTQLGREKHEIVLVSGIGQAAKLPHHVDVNVFSGLHGRALPAAAAIKMANPALTVVVTSGDGDIYGEGGNHFLHNIRRNIDIALFVHDNQVYGLTKGQPSPTSDPGWTGSLNRSGVISEPFPPLAVAVALGCGFVARGLAADVEFTADLMLQAIRFKGFALVDILQPCVTFNKKNTYQWYGRMAVKIPPGHDATDRMKAFALALEWEERIPIGVLYRSARPTFEELHPAIPGPPLHARETPLASIQAMLRKRTLS